MSRESFGHMEDEKIDRENEIAKISMKKRFVPIEEVPSGVSIEDELERRAMEAKEEERLSKIDDGVDDSRSEDEESDTESEKEPRKPILVNGLDISSAVSGAKGHKGTTGEGRFDDFRLKTDREAGKEHDSLRKTTISKKRRADSKISPKK